MSLKIKVIKKADLEAHIAKSRAKKFPEVKKLPDEKREYAVARGSGGFKRFKVQHPTYGLAEEEAKRLAKQEGGTYLIVSVVSKVYGKANKG